MHAGANEPSRLRQGAARVLAASASRCAIACGAACEMLWMWVAKKLRPALGGELAAREPVWDGEGWGCDRVAGLRYLLLFISVGTGGGDGRAAVAKRNPYVRVVLRLALDEAVTGLGPEHDFFGLIVEDELALVAFHGQNRMAFAHLVAHHRDQQRFARPAGVDQHLALQQ